VTPKTHPEDRRAFVAIDLGAESCRVSLLTWRDNAPRIEMLHRIANGPVQSDEHMRWPLERILTGIEEGLRKAAAQAPEGIRSIAVDGWAVDLVRLPVRLQVRLDGEQDSASSPAASPLYPPYCYRDERTVASKAAADAIVPPEEFFALTGAQPLRINTVYQLLADQKDGVDPAIPWLLLPEYVLHWLGGKRVAEYTNATHTGLVDIETGNWSQPLFERLGLSIDVAPGIVPAGAVVGKLRGDLARLSAFRDTVLIAPACHDTASAIAAISYDLTGTAYIVSGTWSLVGTVIDRPINSAEAQRAGFTNQGAATGGFCFHTNVNGMWLLKQCFDHWNAQGRAIALPLLIARAAEVTDIPGLIDVDSPPLLLAGEMPARINHELEQAGLSQIPDEPGNEPVFARVIFASLASRYATVLRNLETLTGRTFQRITTLGGGSRNALLSRLTEESTGLPVFAGEVEGSTLGNFAVQLASHHQSGSQSETGQPLSASKVREWAARLAAGDTLRDI
jgi:rhamnulokinase